MRKLKSAGLIFILFPLVWIFTITDARTRGRADVRGVITNISQIEGEKKILGRILIEGAKEKDTEVDKANVTVTSQTKLFKEQDGERKLVAFDDLKKGQHVEARFTGPVMESYPVQATADEVTILRQ
jgi:Protein of unknown function (DUF3221)